MDIDELNSMWAIDGKINDVDITGEVKKIPQLHQKYYKEYIKQHLKVKKLKSELIELEKAKTEYFNGSMDIAELKERGWQQNPLKILRADIPKYIESEKDIITLSLRIDYHQSIEKYLEDIIKQINSRNFLLKTIVDWAKFTNGS